ncbi:MAG: hypothetical protein J6D54_12240 [Olsenella sp.]|nr:hypothetical protein [Olsenella sp.]
MPNKNVERRGGVGFLSLLGLLFIGLRLAGLIDWSWWVVLSPIWVQLAVLMACFVILGVVYFSEHR